MKISKGIYIIILLLSSIMNFIISLGVPIGILGFLDMINLCEFSWVKVFIGYVAFQSASDMYHSMNLLGMNPNNTGTGDDNVG